MGNGSEPDGTDLDDPEDRSADGDGTGADEPSEPDAASAAPEESPEGPAEDEPEAATAGTGAMAVPGEATADDTAATEPDEEHEIRQRRLEERELGLDKRAEELDEREAALDGREADLDDREAELTTDREDLEDWRASLDHREETLDEREAELEAYEDELEEWSDQLADDEERIQHYVAAQVEDLESTIGATITAAMDDYEEARQPGRFGRTGDLVATIVGLVVTSGGVGYGTWVSVAPDGGFFPSMFSEYIFAIALVIIGVVITLVIVTDRF